MDAQKVLENILADYVRDFKASNVVQAIDQKIKKGIFQYSDAGMLAQESGRILESAFRKYLPETLTDGKLFRETAETVLKNPMLKGCRNIKDVAVRIQNGINKRAGIRINAIVPEVNEDQINGIISGICRSGQTYETGKEELFDQVENFLEGYVDDFVHDNAEFQYQTGMEPRVIRTAAGKCCRWCDNLTGTYLYEDVRDKGNDVWRRHNNCHCSIEYIPAKGTKRRDRKPDRIRWTQEDEDAKIAYMRDKHDLNDIERGFEEGRVYEKTWQKASLQETVARFAPNAVPFSEKNGRKIIYEGDKYTVAYDTGGNYFRIRINGDETIRNFADLDGNKVMNIIENGKQRGASNSEYEALTHFINTDSERRR